MTKKLIQANSEKFYLVFRVIIGILFFMHGWMKIQSLSAINGFFTNKLGLPPGTATFIALVEIIGGLMLVFGVWTRVAGVVLGIEMLVALFLTVPTNTAFGGHELEIMLMASSFGVALAGAGKVRLTHLFELDN